MLTFKEARRQGEILMFKLPDDVTLPKYATKVKGNVIREGEQSGHKHEVIGDGQLVLFPDTGDMAVKVGKKGATVIHPEHKPVKLNEGNHAVKIQKEYDPKKHSKDVKD